MASPLKIGQAVGTGFGPNLYVTGFRDNDIPILSRTPGIQSPTDFGGISAVGGTSTPAPLSTPSSVTPENSLAGQSFAPLLDTLHGIGKPSIGTYAPVAPQFENMAPVPIARPDNSYYQNLFGAKFAPLQQQYFGKNNISDQSVGEAARRGFMDGGPSGVAAQLYEKKVTDLYARAVTDIQNQVNIIKTETEMDLAKYDAGRKDEFYKFRADLLERDRTYGISSAQAQASIDNTYLSLEKEIESAIATGATDEKLAELNARVSTFQTLVNERTQIAKIIQDAADERARLGEQRRANIADWYNEAGQFAGGLAPRVPFEELGVPRPVNLYKTDENGDFVMDKNGNYIPDENGRPLPSGNTGTSATNQPINIYPPGQGGAPSTEGSYNGEIRVGRDGSRYKWNFRQGTWISVI